MSSAGASEGAPVVIAKGYDEIALYIRKLAKDNSIPVIENKPLARGTVFARQEALKLVVSMQVWAWRVTIPPSPVK